MRFLTFILTAFCVVKVSEGYLCYECNSTFDENCFDFSPTYKYYKAVHCDVDDTKNTNCYAVQISERKQRKMYRGCGKANICHDYEDIEKTNYFKVLTCEECKEHYCNNSTRHEIRTSLILFLSIVLNSLFR